MEQNDINKLDVVYGQIYEVSIMIGQLIDRKQYYNLDNFLTVKEQLYTEAEQLLKNIGKDLDLSQFIDICTKIKDQEAINISLLNGIKTELQQEIRKVNKKSKVISAYANVETQQGNLLDFKQ